MTSDFRIQDTGSNFVLLYPTSEAGKNWLGEHVPEDALWYGAGLVVEHRYLEALLLGIEQDGLKIE